MTCRNSRQWMLCVLATVATCAVAMTGCSALPTTGSPQRFDVADTASAPLDLSAAGPTRGATPTTLLSDFLLACAAGPTDDFQTARKFLTDSAAKAWRPTGQVQIYATGTAPTLASDNPEADGQSTQTTSMTLDATLTGTLDQTGVLSLAWDQPTLHRTFGLTKVAGEWRISALDNEIILSEASFRASYQRVNLYFPTVTQTGLVPDPRWYPARRLSSYLLSGLVGGPSAGIAKGVANAIPAGTSIPSQAVSVADRVASVELAGDMPPTATAQQLMASEITQTLLQSRTVDTVRVSISGSRLQNDQLLPATVAPPDSAVGLVDGEIVAVSSSGASAAGVPVPEGASNPAQGLDSPATTAWLEGDSVTVTNQDHTAHAQVATPTWPTGDQYGWVWTASGVPGGPITAVTAEGQLVSVESPTTGTVKTLRISPDGARAVMVIQQGADSALMVSAVERDADGRPVRLDQPSVLGALKQNVLDASWAGADSVVALARDRTVSTGVSVVVVSLGGFVSYLEAPSGVTSLSAGGAPSVIWVSGSDGSVHSRSGSTWQTLDLATTDVHWPG